MDPRLCLIIYNNVVKKQIKVLKINTIERQNI